MRRTRHTPEQIVAKLREADAMLAAGRTVAQVVQQLGVSEQTYNRWRAQYGGMKEGEARRLRELEVENTRLKRLVADQALDMAILRDGYVPPAVFAAGLPSRPRTPVGLPVGAAPLLPARPACSPILTHRLS